MDKPLNKFANKPIKKTRTNEKIIPANKVENKDAGELFKKILTIIPDLYEGEEFLLSDMWPGYIWNRIPLKTRLELGTVFKSNIKILELDVEELGKLSSNQILYCKRTRKEK